jgi:hypothetical protein
MTAKAWFDKQWTHNVLMPPEYYLHGVPMKRKRGRPSSVKDKKEEEEEPEVPRKKPPVICFRLSVIIMTRNMNGSHIVGFMGANDVFSDKTYVKAGGEGSCSTPQGQVSP